MDESPPAPRKRLSRVEVTCEVCPTVFHAKPSEIARGAGRYCSRDCRAVARSQKRPPKEDVSAPRKSPPLMMTCPCGTNFRVHPHRAQEGRLARFCSTACRDAHATGRPATAPMMPCKHCGTPFRYYPGSGASGGEKQRHYCSLVCRKFALRAKRKAQWDASAPQASDKGS